MKRFADSHIHFYDYDYKKSELCLNSLEALGVTDTVTNSLVAYPGDYVAANLFALYFKEKYKGNIKLRAFGSFHEYDVYKNVPYEKQLESLLDMGCEGMKFIHMKPNARKLIGKGLNDKSYDGVLSMMEELRVPMVVHSGDPAIFWDKDRIYPSAIERGWFYGDGSYMPYLEYYREDFEMLDKHPGLNITFAHFFFLGDNYDEAVRVMETYPNVKFDLTPAWEVYVDFAERIDDWHGFFEKYSDRILFGTDSSDRRSPEGTKSVFDLVYNAITHSRDEYREEACRNMYIRGLYCSESTVRKITYDNFAAFAGEDIKPVKLDAVYSSAERMLHDLRDDESATASKSWLESILHG